MHSFQFYQATLDSLRATIAIIDRLGVILFVNRSWREFAVANGASPEQVSEGCNYFAVCEKSAADGCAEARFFAEQALKMVDGEIEEFTLEYPCHAPDRQRWFQVRVTRLQYDRSGRIVIAHEDLTLIKRAEQELKKREVLLDQIVNISPNLVFVKDAAGRYLLANHASAAMYGRSPKEMIGRTDDELVSSSQFPTEDAKSFHQADKAVFTTREAMVIDEQSFTDHRGIQRWFRTVRAPIFIDGEVRYLAGIANDITRNREQEQAVRNAQLRLQTILNTLNHEITLFDKEARVVWANDRACQQAGRSLAESVGQPCGRFYCRICHDGGDCPVRTVLATVKRHQRTLTTTTGATLALSANPVIDENQELVGAVLVVEDVTERLSLEQQLRQAQKLESLGTLAGGIAHDFNNILTAILGFTELCLDRSATDPVMKEDLEEVYRASLRARELVEQILTFSRRNEEETKPLDIALLIKEATKLLRATLPSTIEIKSRFSREVGMVRAEPSRIHQILMNLCTNAAHAMRESGGVLSLSLSSTEIVDPDRLALPFLIAGRTYARLEVSDTGCGMDPEMIPLIFDPYFTTKEKGEGTGLGLAVVHGIVRDYDGAITVDSIPGKGSSFVVYLPLHRDEKQVSETQRTETVQHGHGESLLVVDDEPGITRFYQKVLARAGYRVSTENDSRQALEIIRSRQQPIDLLISDMTMPGLTGERLAQQARQAVPDLPVILISGNRPGLPESLAGYEAIESLAKPIDRDRLLATIRKLLGGDVSSRE